jgi:hypothetical protein
MTGRELRVSGLLASRSERGWLVDLNGGHTGQAILPQDVLEKGGYKRARVGDPINCTAEQHPDGLMVVRIHSLQLRA